MTLFADRLAKLAQLLGTDGVVTDAGIVSTIARDSEVTTAANAAQSAAIAAAATDATTKANAAQAAAIASAATDATTKANAAAAASQPLDSDLTAFAGLAIASDKLPYGTGSHTLGLADFTAAGRALVDDAAASDQRTTLGLGTLATQSGTFSGTSSGTNTGDQTIPVGGTPALTLGTANTAGTSPNFLRRDDTILAFDATTPAAVGTAAVGAATTTARRDHVHATGAGTPTTQAFGDAAATGSGPAAAMTDHKHAMPALGTGATNAAAGNDSRLSDSRAPSGSAGGGLTGTYPNPTVATNANLTGDVTSVGNAATVVQASGAFALTGVITPTQLAANTDDWAPTGLASAVRIRASTDASRNLTGLTGGASGRMILLSNVGSFNLVLMHDATSTAANRFYCLNSTDVTMPPNSTVWLLYDNTSSRWRVEAVAYGTPTTQAFGDAAVAGTVATHKHGMPAALVNTINFVIDGGGSVITTGVKGDIVIDFACTINAVKVIADQSGSIVVDIWKHSYVLDTPPVSGDKITASAPPTLSSHESSLDSTLTGWTTAIVAGDTLRFNVTSATTVQRVTVSLKVTRT